ncbi:TetR family transcriptional regulator [Kribbella voronezhensis]|uniref:TetR family transcriptional regulator n=1 Tax=Kribbella voronezhensis TaxID=2512212 RepID=A0A4R7TF12_9ACTN|nr:TetR/AcrR family transcriptional regulator [Kribbella voronezhensis]TDU90008.1 TetR family transcriptional regulator [Kribbella voronezhensis]
MIQRDDASPIPRPGGRTARVRADVLAAVERELAASGYDNLTIEMVAASSGVHRTTIYRRWGSVAGLLVDLLASGADDDWQPADTGSLEADLIRLNREVRDALAQQPSLTGAVIAASFRTAEAAEALTSFWQDRYVRSEVVVSRAIDRGEIPSDTDAQRLLIACTAPVYHQLVLLRQPMTRAAADRAAKDAAAAARAGVYVR